MALVVVLRDYEIKFPLERAIEHCVAGDGPLDVDAFLLGDLDRRLDALDFLPAENAPFATVRIQAGDGDARFGDAEFTKVLVSRADRGDNSGARLKPRVPWSTWSAPWSSWNARL